MRPIRDCTLVDLLDKILDKGVMLSADVIVSVSGIPLIGISLRAALAGIETMLDYGMMEAWDESIRAYYAADLTKKAPPLDEHEKVIFHTFGAYRHSYGLYDSWLHGYLYLTNRRLFIYRKEPGQILCEVPLNKIRRLTVKKTAFFGKERYELQLEGQNTTRIYADELLYLKEAIEAVKGNLYSKEDNYIASKSRCALKTTKLVN